MVFGAQYSGRMTALISVAFEQSQFVAFAYSEVVFTALVTHFRNSLTTDEIRRIHDN